MKKILSTLAVTALVVPAGAMAAKPSDPGSKGQEKSSAKSKRCKKGPSVGYTATGTLVGTPTVNADGTTTLVVNVTKTNKHAKALKGDGKTITVKSDAVKYSGNEAADDGDRVKINGKVLKPKAKCPAATAEQLEAKIRKVTITEPEAAEEQQPAAAPAA